MLNLPEHNVELNPILKAYRQLTFSNTKPSDSSKNLTAKSPQCIEEGKPSRQFLEKYQDSV